MFKILFLAVLIWLGYTAYRTYKHREKTVPLTDFWTDYLERLQFWK